MNEQYNDEQVIKTEDNLNSGNARVCPNCKITLESEHKFCPSCGAKTEELPAQEKICGNCGSKMSPEMKFCSVCGKESEGAADEKIPRECPKCKTVLADEQSFCPVCGTEAQDKKDAQKHKCESCGIEISPETVFCPNCGKKSKLSHEKKKHNRKLNLILAVFVVAIISAASFAIWFICREIPVEDIELSESAIELKKEETKNISCTVYPEKATDKTVIWTSSDEAVATVNSYGMITAIDKGTCTITAQSGEQTETITVTVVTNVDFEKLYDDYCSSMWATLGSDNSYLSIDSEPGDGGTLRYFEAASDAVEKINRALGLPEYLQDEIAGTSSSEGRQKEEFKDIGVSVSWSFGLYSGIEVTYRIID